MVMEQIDANTTWASHESGIEGVYSHDGMRALYRDTVDKEIYPCFEGWLWDMERSATFHQRRGAMS